MNFKIKPIAAGAAVGAVLAAGAVFAIDSGSEPAEAQSNSSLQQQINELKGRTIAVGRNSSAAQRIAKTNKNIIAKYLYPDGQQIGYKTPPGVIKQDPGTGTEGIPYSVLSPGVQNLQVYNANYYYNNGAPQQQGRALEGIQRNNTGDYYFQWPIDVSMCTVQASPAYYGGADPSMGDQVGVYKAPNNNWWQIKYYGWDQATKEYAPKDGPVSVLVQCGTNTTGSN